MVVRAYILVTSLHLEAAVCKALFPPIAPLVDGSFRIFCHLTIAIPYHFDT
jgi:hypothetical protein